VESLNQKWSSDGFHGLMAKLAGIRQGDRVLDLGCGRGKTIRYLLGKIGTTGKVVAADRSSDNLAALRDAFPDAVATGRLSVANFDLVGTWPFEDASFDSIVCQNVVECVADKNRLMREVHRILKPNGAALIGHYDFDGVLIASEDRDLTRRMVHGYADHTQEWMDVSDGQMGRLLPGLLAHSPFKTAETETLLFIDLVLSKDSYAGIHLDGMVALSTKFGVAAENAMKWLRGLEARSDAGMFYYALPWVYVLARKESQFDQSHV
jgi:SAM-dependent methyltransferase